MDETPSGFFSEMNSCPGSVENIIGVIKALMKICGSKPRVIAPAYCFMPISHTVDLNYWMG